MTDVLDTEEFRKWNEAFTAVPGMLPCWLVGYLIRRHMGIEDLLDKAEHDWAEWWPHLCAGAYRLRNPEYINATQLDIALAYAARIAPFLTPADLGSENPHLCTGPRDWHPFRWMKDAPCYEP